MLERVKNSMEQNSLAPKGPNIFSILKPYRSWIFLLIGLALASNSINLFIPKTIGEGIDAFVRGSLDKEALMFKFFLMSGAILIFTSLQNIIQTYTSERVARDLREKLTAKISSESYSAIQELTPSRLLTNLTSDIDSIKMFVSMAIVSLVSSVCLIIGASLLLISIDWELGLAVLMILPLIGGTFFYIFSKIGVMFKVSQEVIDKLNKVINESILGSSLIRVLNSQVREYTKFLAVNGEAKNVGMQILRLFSSLIPVVVFISNMALLVILMLGGKFVIDGEMTLGSMSAFLSYVGLLIFPIIMIGFMSNLIARASASYARVAEVLNRPEKKETGTITKKLKGDVVVENVSLEIAKKPVLKNISFVVPAGTKTAIIGPTAAGKTQLLYTLTGLLPASSGTISFDKELLENYDQESLHEQIGFVFQDSIIFNMSVRENIAFREKVNESDVQKAIETAELQDFIEALPEKIDTVISERGTSLSGGQKQRIMLARALALNPKILLLDDFTARIDALTEKKIIANIEKNYPGITLISVTQKIASVEEYDQIILIMEGEILAKGLHEELTHISPEYMQIYESQRSTSHYEV
jgi:ATP-binding cassette subfamily B protein